MHALYWHDSYVDYTNYADTAVTVLYRTRDTHGPVLCTLLLHYVQQ
jgi:hypothetical protein